jgi:hypothetical protein
MAIKNLQAIINIEDVDLAITLLQQNGWDESLAASAYMAPQQVSQLLISYYLCRCNTNLQKRRLLINLFKITLQL